MQIILTKGLPGSGKSTWALKFIRNKPNWTRINKDEIRERLHGGAYSPDLEMLVEDERDSLVLAALRNGVNVVIDDTNLNPKHIERIQELAFSFLATDGVEVEVTEQDFTDVSLETCIRRDSKRARPVGEDSIRDMHDRFLSYDSGRSCGSGGYWQRRNRRRSPFGRF